VGDLRLEERFTLFLAWPHRCVWCTKPITFATFEVEHLIPRSLSGTDRAEALALHGLTSDFDLESLENLAPACRECNGGKGDRVPPRAPGVSILLDKAKEHAPGIRAAADKRISKAKVSNALGVLRVAAANEDGDRTVRELVRSGLAEVMAEIERVTGVLQEAAATPAPATEIGAQVEVPLHPALSLVFQSRRWKVSGRLSDEVIVVHDDHGRGGYVGTSWSFACPHCGSHGPWNGVRCETCGRISDPSD
jgi:hypothetical protein